jgi:hypothetical protein
MQDYRLQNYPALKAFLSLGCPVSIPTVYMLTQSCLPPDSKMMITDGSDISRTFMDSFTNNLQKYSLSRHLVEHHAGIVAH